MAQTLQEYTAEKEAEAKDIKAQNREAKLRDEIKFHKNETEKYNKLAIALEELNNRQLADHKIEVAKLKVDLIESIETLSKKNDEVITLREVQKTLVPTINALEEEIILMKKIAHASNEDLKNELKADMQIGFDNMRAQMLAEMAKMSNVEIVKITSAMAQNINIDEIQDTVDAIVRTRLAESVNTIVEGQNKTVDIMPALENVENKILMALDEQTQYLDEGQDGMIEIIKEHIDSIPKPIVEAPQSIDLTKIEEKIIDVLSKKIEKESNLIMDFIDDVELKPSTIASTPTSTPASTMSTVPSTSPSTIEDLKPTTPTQPSNNIEIELKPSTITSTMSTVPSTITSTQRHLPQNQEKIVNSLRIKKQSQKELSDELDMNKGTVSGNLNSLVEKRIIKIKDGIYEVII